MIDHEGLTAESEECIDIDGTCLVCERCMVTDERNWGGWQKVAAPPHGDTRRTYVSADQGEQA